MGKRSEKSRNNLYAMVCHTIVDVVLVAAYAIETFVKQDRELWHFAIVLLLGLVPIIIEHILFKKNNETMAIKHCIGYGFALFYAFLLFTANNPLTFTYVILMILVISVFNDRSYAIKVNVGVVVLNTIQVIIGYKTNSLGYNNLASAEIQVILMILMASFSIVQSEVLNKNNKQKLELIKKQQESAENKYKETLQIVEQMTKDINTIYTRVEELSSTTNYTRNAMEEVSKGSADTSEAVQNQLIQTQNIQNNLSEVDNAANTLLNEMSATRSEIETGRVNMEDMVQKVNDSVESGREVAEQLETLDEKITEMNSIVEIINGIASKTAMLALNASIEAARAGEAGRGFSVVATQISSMATQTKDATVHITDLIHNVSEAISKVVTVIREMIEDINRERDITASTEHSFVQISESSDVMNGSIVRLTEILSELVKANTDIIDSIQTISGVSEEVSAHASETFNAEEDNADKLKEISEFMEDLKELTNRL